MFSNFKFVFQCFFVVFLFSIGFSNGTTTAAQTCNIDMSKSQFDVVVLQDTTVRGEIEAQKLKGEFGAFCQAVKDASPDSRFGYGGYNTYPDAMPSATADGVVIKSFEVLSSLDSSTTPFLSALESSFTQLAGSGSQTSLLAAALSAQDKSLCSGCQIFGWSSGPANGKKLYKIIIINTEKKSYLPTPKGGVAVDDYGFSADHVVWDDEAKKIKKVDRAFYGLGNDNAASEPPSVEQLQNILKAKDMGLLVLNRNDENSAFWASSLSYQQKPFGIQLSTKNIPTVDGFATQVLEALQKAACLADQAKQESSAST